MKTGREPDFRRMSDIGSFEKEGIYENYPPTSSEVG